MTTRTNKRRLRVIVQRSGNPELPWLATIHDMQNEKVVYHSSAAVRRMAKIVALTGYQVTLRQHLRAVDEMLEQE